MLQSRFCVRRPDRLAEASGSAPIYPLLKRVDERHVTMQAYDEPTFVEDVVRRVTLAAEDERIKRFTVHAENQESIHNHAAVATVHWQRRMSGHIRVITTCTSRKVALETELDHAALPGMAAPLTAARRTPLRRRAAPPFDGRYQCAAGPVSGSISG